jgi:single-strand DNA-binding protein
MNKCFLVGNVVKEPEVSETSSGVAYCNLRIAVARQFSNAEGKKDSDFFNVVVWRDMGVNCGRYLKKGSKVAVVGSLQNRTYEDKNGIKRTVTDIVASEVEFLSAKEEKEDKPKLQLEPADEESLPF